MTTTFCAAAFLILCIMGKGGCFQTGVEAAVVEEDATTAPGRCQSSSPDDAGPAVEDEDPEMSLFQFRGMVQQRQKEENVAADIDDEPTEEEKKQQRRKEEPTQCAYTIPTKGGSESVGGGAKCELLLNHPMFFERRHAICTSDRQNPDSSKPVCKNVCPATCDYILNLTEEDKRQLENGNVYSRCSYKILAGSVATGSNSEVGVKSCGDLQNEKWWFNKRHAICTYTSDGSWQRYKPCKTVCPATCDCILKPCEWKHEHAMKCGGVNIDLGDTGGFLRLGDTGTECNATAGEVSPTKAECSNAAKALGKTHGGEVHRSSTSQDSDSFFWTGDTKKIPCGCSIRHNKLHWNEQETVCAGRSDLAPICLTRNVGYGVSLQPGQTIADCKKTCDEHKDECHGFVFKTRDQGAECYWQKGPSTLGPKMIWKRPYAIGNSLLTNATSDADSHCFYRSDCSERNCE